MSFRCGKVAVVGASNVGKSTLVNTIVGCKVGIVSDKPQTTRKSVLGILNLRNAQVVFIDTPGIHQAKTKFGKYLLEESYQSVLDSDLVLFVVDVSVFPTAIDQHICGFFKKHDIKNVVVALNKMDRLRPEYVQAHYEAYEALIPGVDRMYTCALTGENTDKLVDMIIERLPVGEALYENSDYYTNQLIRDMVAELIREQVLNHTKDEIPHGIVVLIEEWIDSLSNSGDELTKISASIVVEKQTHKPILIGKGGQMLKKIGTSSRHEIERFIGNHVYLNLFVKVKENWRNKPHQFRELGIVQ